MSKLLDSNKNEAASKLLDPNSKLQIPMPIASLMKLDNDSGVKGSLENSREYIPVRGF